jgi:hypothetical protein
MAVTPNAVITAQGLATAQAVATAAKTTYSDNTNAVLLLTAGSNGAVLYGLTASPRATVTATQLQLFSSPNGTAMNLINTALMGAYTMAQTTQAPQTAFSYGETSPRRLAPNEQLWIGIGVTLAGGVVFDAQYENL